MNTAVNAVPTSQRRGRSDLETTYEQFCLVARPLTTFGIFFAVAFIASLLAVAWSTLHFRYSSRHDSVISQWIARYLEEIIGTLPALVIAIRGRRLLKTVILGELSLWGTIVIGVAAGCATSLSVSIIGLWHYHWPSVSFSRIFQPTEAMPINVYLIGPFYEEMLFQVGVQTWLQRLGPVVAVLGTAFLFWAEHAVGILFGDRTWTDVLVFILPGMFAFALVRQTTKSFGAAVLAHCVYNVLAANLLYYPRSSIH